MADWGVLSETARLVWGKTNRDRGLVSLPLFRHLADSADVAGLLWDVWLPVTVRQRIAGPLPGGAGDGRILVRWLAGIHDIGKATPAFTWQVAPLRKEMRDHGFSFDRQVEAGRLRAPHGAAGQIVLVDWLTGRHGWDPSLAETYAVVVGGHHGVPPTDAGLTQIRERPYLLGAGGIWPAVQDELLGWVTHRVAAAERLPAWREVVLPQPVQVLLTAIVIVADWIASNEEFFPYGFRQEDAPDRLQQAWEELDLPTPWRAVDTTGLDAATLFARRFEMPAGSQPYPVQAAVVEQARVMPLPGLLIVEAPMGEGKTEAALAAVEILAARSGAAGCFVALPTRATSDAMFSRVLGWLSRLPDADLGRGAREAALAHGKAILNDEYSRLYRGMLPSAIGVDEGGTATAAHAWLAGRKRKMLSSFVVGTVDQLLFAALQARHVVLRHLGLAGKVVVIDEAHAYDVYMSQYLDRALEWLGAHGVPVVILSATLPARRRADMMRAYDVGRLGRRSAAQRRRFRTEIREVADEYQVLRDEQRYPLLSVSGVERAPAVIGCGASGRSFDVRLERTDDDLAVLTDRLRTDLADGGCVLVIRNTVARVLETADELRSQLAPGIPVTVAHSRFMAADRAAKDTWLRDTFGPPEHLAKLGRARPACHVVVASQVAEQSLDIDFDLLVTDLAPVDLILQRLGRLHRHRRSGRPGRLAQPRCLVTGVDWATVPPTPVRGSVKVYQHHALLRAIAVLLPYLDGDRFLCLPQDIAPLVQTAYGTGPVGPQSWQSVLAEAAVQADDRAEAARKRADTFRVGPVQAPGASLMSWLDASVGDSEGADGNERRGRAHVRDDGAEALEVLILVRRGEKLVTPPWLDRGGDVEVPTDFEPPRAVARTMLRCALPLPQAITANGGIDRIITELEQRNTFPAWKKDRLLGGELVLDLDEQGRSRLTEFILSYDQGSGLRVEKADR
ncbi:CRISPR-associated nuclease/helicase Cas3 [Micromonospora sp. MH33]|uniref:CRISPR-associated helicase/endonuclease Cas3 n=1 Tax=Micromonospora sp. MH33 TaxID=1945509 RepID=UPI000D14A226|nr:CRISPR-associated helicase/endonuclease Cas3 [Micromonospora sp. MH33]PSK61773.1 CRISPR-associated nuclease/helicase Cas3 [Micromonospora sp. MH33]